MHLQGRRLQQFHSTPTAIRSHSVLLLVKRIVVSIAKPTLDEFVHDLEANPGELVRVAAGTRSSAHELEIILSGRRPALTTGIIARLFRPPAALRYVSHHYWEAFEHRHYSPPTLDLALCSDALSGGSAALLDGDRVLPVAEVRVLGPGMHRWVPGVQPALAPDEVPSQGRFSRYAGALGGLRTLDRLQRLRVALLGAGALGEGVTLDLARGGLRVLRHPQGLPSACEARIGSADILLSSRSGGDRAPVALQASTLACAYLRPHLDLCTVELPDGPGVDLHLTLPGESPCIACGCARAAEGREETRVSSSGIGPALESFAIGLAVTWVERLVTGSLTRPTAARLRSTPSGEILSEPLDWPEGDPTCLACARTGMGELELSGAPRA